MCLDTSVFSNMSHYGTSRDTIDHRLCWQGDHVQHLPSLQLTASRAVTRALTCLKTISI